MLRALAIAAMFALAVPTLAAAQAPPPPPHGKPPPGPHGPPPGPPHRPPPGPHGVPHGQFSYHGHAIHRLHIAPFIYPHGWGYRRWGIGAVLPPIFLVPDYYYTDWAALGLDAPPPGFEWVRYGPDLLLVNLATGQITETLYGVFY